MELDALNITFAGVECTHDAPEGAVDGIAAGPVTISYTNETDGWIDASVYKLKDGVTWDEIFERSALLGKALRLAFDVADLEDGQPRDRTLLPGIYVVQCVLFDFGVPAKGWWVGPFTVVEA